MVNYYYLTVTAHGKKKQLNKSVTNNFTTVLLYTDADSAMFNI